jgi:hypothetical protein
MVPCISDDNNEYKTNQMQNSIKIIKILLYSYFALHVSGTFAPIIRSLLILHIQPPVTVCRWVGLSSSFGLQGLGVAGRFMSMKNL